MNGSDGADDEASIRDVVSPLRTLGTTAGIVATDPWKACGFDGSVETCFRIAQLRSDGPTSWYRVVASGDLAHNLHAALRKGDRVIFDGTLSDERGGETTGSLTVTLTHCGHDLNYGTSSWSLAPGGRR